MFKTNAKYRENAKLIVTNFVAMAILWVDA